MSGEALVTRGLVHGEKASQGLLTSLVLHVGVLGALGVAAWVSGRAHPRWGDANPVAGAIAANVVSALPLPPKQRFKEHEVLASEKPSVAPTPPQPEPVKPQPKTEAKPKAEPPPKPNEVLLAKKTETPKTPAKAAEREQPKPVTRPPPTNKATTGETAGIQIPQSVTQLRNGTASLTVEERTFGDRFAYYTRLIAQKINQSKQEGGLDPADAKGKRILVHFFIERDGTPTDIEIATKSGSAALDLSTLRAIQRIDTFGPLPQGDHLPIMFTYDAK